MEVGSCNVPLWGILAVVLFCLYMLYMLWHIRVFSKMGVKGPMPLPLFGNFLKQTKLGFMKVELEWMKQYGEVWGVFDGRSPNLFVANEEMLKDLFVKKFSDFTDRRTIEGLNGDFDHGVSLLKGEHWKTVRNLMTPTFSSGKLRQMSNLIQEASGVLVENMESQLDGKREMEMKKVFGSYTMDVICSTAFGIKVNSQKDPNDPFVRNASKVLAFDFKSPIMLLAFFAPFLLGPVGKLFGVSLIDKDVQKFFRSVVVKEINNRRTEREDYVDFMQLMIQSHDENPDLKARKGLTFNEIVGNSLLFFFAGYETTATTLCLLSHNLALYPDIQERVLEEVERELGDESPNYENVNKLVYLEMCINETLRLFPPATRLDRHCVNDSDLNGLPVSKGMYVTVPIWGIHHSPEYWPDPDVFDPERFSPENKHKISPYRFLPFGYGPRICIGIRLALLELKIAYANVIRKFKFSVGEKTKIPPELATTGLIAPKELWLNVEKR